MGIFKRVKTIAAADMNSLLDRFEDPVSMAKQYIRQVEEQIDNAREALANQLASEEHYTLLVARTEEIVAKRSRQAELAVEREEDGIAELALQEKLHHQKLLSAYQEQRDAIRRQIETLKGEIARLAELHQELQSKLTYLITRAQAAQAIEAAASAAPSFKTDELIRNFSRLEAKVWRMEAGAAAARQVSAAADPLNQLGQQEEVRFELEKLKAARHK
jgi:phage shock protein A